MSLFLADDSVRLLRRRLDAAMALVDTTGRLANEHDLDAVLRTVAESVRTAVECERASLFVLDENRGELFTRVVTELEIEEIRLPVGRGVAGWVAEHRRIASIPDPPADARWSAEFDRRTGFQTQNILAVPILSVSSDRLVGVLQLLNKHEGSFDEFDERLVRAFATHAGIALERAQLLEEVRKSHELEVAVDMGRTIQASFLPEELPQIAGYDVSAWWQPAEAVSGDYYDLIPLSDGRLALVVADVSGHGIGPALIMASVRAMLHVLTRTVSEPQHILSELSGSITPDLQEGRFITLLITALDPTKHEVGFANAGHGPALHYSVRTRTFRPLVSTGLPFGFGGPYHPAGGRKLTLEPGDLLILATDGATEVRSPSAELFGRTRLEQIVQNHADGSAEDVVSAIRDAVLSFAGGAPPEDDVTLLVLKRKPD